MRLARAGMRPSQGHLGLQRVFGMLLAEGLEHPSGSVPVLQADEHGRGVVLRLSCTNLTMNSKVFMDVSPGND